MPTLAPYMYIVEPLLVGKDHKVGNRRPLILTNQAFWDQEISFRIKREFFHSQKPFSFEGSYFDVGERCGREFHLRRAAGVQDIL